MTRIFLTGYRKRFFHFFRNIMFAIFVILLIGVNSNAQSKKIFFDIPSQEVASAMDAFAEQRYKKAIRYMEESRFELAQEQFAVVAATADSPELKELGLAGYSKAGTAIVLKR